RVRRTRSRRTLEPAAHRPLVARLVVVAILTKRPVVLLAAQRAPRELAIAPAQQIDRPHQRRAAGSRDVLDESLVLVPIGDRVNLKPLRLTPRLGDGFVRLRALVRLNLEDLSRARRPGGPALALRVIRLERRDRAQEQRSIPFAAEQRDRRIQLGRILTEP